MQMNELQQLHGAPVFSKSGEQIGKVEEIFYDVEGGQPEWIGLGTGFFGTKRVLVPVQGTQPQDDGLQAVDESVEDVELGEQELEVSLRGERPVVQKRTVAKERVGIKKDVETQTQMVEDEVRKEHVDVEGDRP